MSFLQNSTTFAPYLNMKPHRTYILYISICLWLLASPLCIGDLWGKDFVVVIDAGHGGHDPGAIGKISKEKNINLNVALKLGNLIKKNCDDVKVIYTRSRDVFIPLDRRAEITQKPISLSLSTPTLWQKTAPPKELLHGHWVWPNPMPIWK